jgi:hypothetical protein
LPGGITLGDADKEAFRIAVFLERRLVVSGPLQILPLLEPLVSREKLFGRIYRKKGSQSG